MAATARVHVIRMLAPALDYEDHAGYSTSAPKASACGARPAIVIPARRWKKPRGANPPTSWRLVLHEAMGGAWSDLGGRIGEGCAVRDACASSRQHEGKSMNDQVSAWEAGFREIREMDLPLGERLRFLAEDVRVRAPQLPKRSMCSFPPRSG